MDTDLAALATADGRRDGEAARLRCLIIRDVDRLGRDQFRTAMALQTITEHGCRVFCFGVNDGEEIKLGSFAEKLMLSVRRDGQWQQGISWAPPSPPKLARGGLR